LANDPLLLERLGQPAKASHNAARRRDLLKQRLGFVRESLGLVQPPFRGR
jgi:hypothetical protein